MLQAINATLSIIAAVRQFLPQIIALIGDVETAMPNATVDAKLNMVTTILQTAMSGIDTAMVDTKAVWPVIEAIIAQHTTQPTSATATTANA